MKIMMDSSMFSSFEDILSQKLNEYIEEKYVKKKDKAKRKIEKLFFNEDIKYVVIQPFQEIMHFTTQHQSQKQVVGIIQEVDRLNKITKTYKVVITGVFLYRMTVPEEYKYVFTTYKEEMSD